MDLLLIGAVGIDSNVYLYSDHIDFDVEMNFCRTLDCVGQSGGYCSRIAAAQGYEAGFFGFVGDDFCGREVRRVLTGDGVDLRGLGLDPSGTKRSVNFLYKDARRRNFYDGKGSMEQVPDLDLAATLLRGVRLAHFSIVNWARDLLPVAARLGVPISCDLQDVVDPDDPYRRDFAAAADVLFFSATNHADPLPLLRHYLAQRPDRTVVCGMGARGAALGRGDSVRVFAAEDLPLPLLDSNGAGDSLAMGYLLARFFEGYGDEDALLRGQLLARHTCSLEGRSDGLIRRAELDRLFAARRA